MPKAEEFYKQFSSWLVFEGKEWGRGAKNEPKEWDSHFELCLS